MNLMQMQIDTKTLSRWESLALVLAKKDGLTDEQTQALWPDLELLARTVLREIGWTNKEIDDPLPSHITERALRQIEDDPEEFSRQCQEAMQWMTGRN